MIKKLKTRYSLLPITAKASLWFVVCSCVQSGIKFIASPIFANLMSVEQYGLVTLYTSWFSIMYIFATLALGRANGVFYVAMVKFSNDKDGFTLAAQGLTAVLCISCFILVYGSVGLFGDWMGIGINQYWAMCLELMGYGFMLIWSLKMRYDYQYKPLLCMTFVYSFGTIIIPILSLLVLPKFDQALVKNISGALFSFAVGIVAIISSSKYSCKLYNRYYWKYAIKFNVPLIPHYLSNVILVQSDRIMIAKIVGEAATAIYSVAYNLGVAAQVITQALINSINPWMYQKIEKKQSDEIRKVVIPLLLVVSVMILGILLIMPELFMLFFPEAYLEALNVIPPVAAGVLWAFIFNIYASLELYYMGNKLVSFASATGAILNVVLNLVCIPIFGYIAAAYTTLSCDIIYAGMHTLFAHKLMRKNMVEKEYILPDKVIWGIGISTTVITFLVMLLYPYILMRYSIVIFLGMAVVIKRKKIVKIITFKTKNN